MVAKTSSMMVSEAQLNAPKGFILVNGMYYNVDRILCFDEEDFFLVHDSVVHRGMSVAELTLLINNARRQS